MKLAVLNGPVIEAGEALSDGIGRCLVMAAGSSVRKELESLAHKKDWLSAAR